MRMLQNSGAGFGYLPISFGTGKTDTMQNAEQCVLSMPTVTPLAVIDHDANEVKP
ncbi:hypothetical protein [Gemmiger sp.]